MSIRDYGSCLSPLHLVIPTPFLNAFMEKIYVHSFIYCTMPDCCHFQAASTVQCPTAATFTSIYCTTPNLCHFQAASTVQCPTVATFTSIYCTMPNCCCKLLTWYHTECRRHSSISCIVGVGNGMNGVHVSRTSIRLV